MLTRQLVLNLSTSFEVPFVYTKNNTKEIEEALWIGATVQQSVKTRRSNDETKKVMELKDSEIQQIQKSYQDKLTKLLEDLQQTSEEKNRLNDEYLEKIKLAQQQERDHTSKEYEEKMKFLRRDIEAISSKCNALEVSRKLLEESRSKDIQDAVQRTETMMEKIISSKQDQLVKMESAYQKLHESISKQSEEIVKLSGSLGKRSSNVKTKGSDYEEQFGEKLKKHFGICPGFALKDTRLGSGHEMDFSMQLENKFIMWELKNYTSVVPKAEVDKFLRDLKENPQTNIGVMISRTTDIYGKYHSGQLLTEFDGDKMMIYLNRFEEFCGDNEGQVFQLLTSLFRLWWNYHHEENHTFDREEMIRELQKAIEELSKRRTEWRRHKAHLDEIARWTTDLLDESESRLDRILKRTSLQQESIEAGAQITLPDDVFRESKEERDIQWGQSIMKVCSVGGQIEVRELVDLLTAHHKLSKDTIRSNIMSIIKDSAVSKKGVVKFIKGISKFVPECKIQLPVSK
jgi:hypothetical protein